jgi:hypothetical protein
LKALYLLGVTTLLFAFCSCGQDENKIETFIFSSAGLHYDYTLKWNSSDTLYFEERFPKPTKTLYAILNQASKDSILDYLKDIKFNSYRSHYIDTNLEDGEAFKFIVVRENKIDSVFIYGKKAPTLFYNIGSTIETIKQKQHFRALGHTIKSVSYTHLRAHETG